MSYFGSFIPFLMIFFRFTIKFNKLKKLKIFIEIKIEFKFNATYMKLKIIQFRFAISMFTYIFKNVT